MPNRSKQRDIVIIGAGPAGLVVASVAAQLGLDVVLVDKNPLLGGDCLHTGCVPSKTLLKIAQVAATVRSAGVYGIKADAPQIDMAQVNGVVKHAIDTIQPHDSRERFESLGCEIITAKAELEGPHLVCAGGARLQAKNIVIATGSIPAIPSIAGLHSVAYLTSDDMFTLPALPRSLLILGAGAVGVEMAQAYARLGCEVSLIESAPGILPQLDAAVGVALTTVLLREGIRIYTNARIVKLSQNADSLCAEFADGSRICADKLLLATGRRVNLDGLGLERAGVSFSDKGIRVNARMQTSVRHIYACGDVTGQRALTHVAEQQAGVIIANVVFKIPKRIDNRVVPSVIYTDPECAQIGMSMQEAVDDKNCKSVRFELQALDRAITERRNDGFANIIVRNNRLVGAQIVAPHAGELIHELALAMQEKIKLSRVAGMVHAYPSYAQLNKRVASAVFTTKLYSKATRTLVKWLHRLLP